MQIDALSGREIGDGGAMDWVIAFSRPELCGYSGSGMIINPDTYEEGSIPVELTYNDNDRGNSRTASNQLVSMSGGVHGVTINEGDMDSMMWREVPVQHRYNTGYGYTWAVIVEEEIDNLCCADSDCEGYWACTAACEPLNARQWVSITAQSGSGEMCPIEAPADCANGQGDCITVDCEGNWVCTEACEAAADRSWTQTVLQEGVGAACPAEAPADCANREGSCVVYCANNVRPENDFDCSTALQVHVQGAAAIEQVNGTRAGDQSLGNRARCCQDVTGMCQNTPVEGSWESAESADFDCSLADAFPVEASVGLITDVAGGAFACCLCPPNTYWVGQLCSPCPEGFRSNGGSVTECSPIFAEPVVEQISWQIIEGQMTRTYALSARLRTGAAQNLYGIIGLDRQVTAEGAPAVSFLPNAYQHPNGTTVGGSSPLPFQPTISSAPYDSFLTIGAVDDSGSLDSYGIDGTVWSAINEMSITDGVIFVEDPDTGPTAEQDVLLAQVTLDAQQPLEAVLNVIGRSTSGRAINAGTNLV
eukprot:SAG31_NODE_5978_length_2229_cov_1.351174_1_plen_533_part_10